MKRPTIALACIMKNEGKNLPILLESVKGCFDEIHFTDTGSTDDSVDIARKHGAQVHFFEWCDDFSKARNYSFSKVNTDYVMWMDLDDSMVNPDEFIKFRDTILNTANYWMAAYHYALGPNKEPLCTFLRERIVKVSSGFSWKYFVHEGIMPVCKEEVKLSYCSTWGIQHRRTQQDLINDRGRNLRLFKKHETELDPRMNYYYGKELFENGQPKESIPYLLKGCSDPKAEPHDRVLGVQYLCYSLIQTGELDRAIKVAHDGLMLMPQRAEFLCLIADCYMKKGQLADAIPYLQAAKTCHFHDAEKTGQATPIFSNKDTYTTYPRNQLARIFANLGRLEEAKNESKESFELFGSTEGKTILDEIEKVAPCNQSKNKRQTDDIVMTCHPNGFYEWDAQIYKEKGIGGSETAAVEMAYHLHKLSGRPVKIFNNRSEAKTIDGVEYIPYSMLPLYFNDHKPYAHIAWRHTLKITDAPTYVWSHDLLTPGAEKKEYTKLLCLSEFHKNFVHSIQGVPFEKIQVTRNGIDPSRFNFGGTKNPNKVIFASSPDRGLIRAMKVMDEVRKTIPDAELHAFYGLDNLYKAGRNDVADKIKAEIRLRPWVTFHGNVDQKTLTKETSDAVVWLYPTDFEETFCITALESLCNKIYPVVRSYGALTNTLDMAAQTGQADLIDSDCVTEEEILLYAQKTIAAIQQEKWKNIIVDPETFSWRKVAQNWLDLFKRELDGDSGQS